MGPAVAPVWPRWASHGRAARGQGFGRRGLVRRGRSLDGIRPGRPGDYPARAPTDPDVRLSRIRLVRSTLHLLRYTEWITRGAGSGNRPSRPSRLLQLK